jgi:hypothetical protein
MDRADQAAAMLAPAIDRVFRAMMAAARERGGLEISRSYGGPPAVGDLVEFRTRLAAPGARVTAEQFAAVVRYRDLASCLSVLNGDAERGTVTVDADGAFAATDRGLAFLAEIYAAHDKVTGELWAEHAERVERLVELTGRLLAAAAETGGPSFAAMAPPHEPLGTAPGTRLLNRLGTLRYHRADAHASAWAEAGLTAAGIATLPPGPTRQAIEDRTNELAAPPFAALTAGERLDLLAGLAALP